MHIRYLTFFFTIAFIWVGFIASFNFVVDPAAIYRAVEIEGFNKIKPKISKYRFIWKSTYIEDNKPEIVFLGNSRVEIGIDPDSLFRLGLLPEGRSAFNSAIPGANVYGVKRFAQQAILAGNVQELYIGMYYIQFRANGLRSLEKNYREHEGVFSVDADGNSQPLHRLVVYSKTLFSVDAFSASMQTLRKQKKKYLSYTEFGHNSNEDMVENILEKGSQRKYFLKEEIRFIDNFVKEKNSSLDYSTGMDDLREILQLAQEHHVKTTLFITPTHVHLQYLDAHLGNADYYYQWKRALTALVSEVNQTAQQPALLWDFSIPAPETEELLPEGDGIMQWYLDPSHFRRELGDKMLLQMLGSQPEAGQGFGVILTPTTIEPAIQKHRQHLLQWQETQPDDYAAFQQRIEKRRELRSHRKSKSTRASLASKAKGA